MAEMTYIFLALVCCLVQCVAADERALLPRLMRNYDKNILPPQRPVNVSFSLDVLRIAVDMTSQTLTLDVTRRQSWLDTRLVWNPYEYSSIQRLLVPADMVWTPDITLGNGYEEVRGKHVQASIGNDGDAYVVDKIIYTVFCSFVLTPNGTYVCTQTFESNFVKQDLDIHQEDNNFLQPDFENSDWELVRAVCRREVLNYAAGSYADLVYTYEIKKREMAITSVKIDETGDAAGMSALPLVFLGFMAPFQFLLPLESSERLSIDGILFLSGILVSVGINDVILQFPMQSAAAAYCDFVLTLLFLCLLLSALNLHMCTSWGKKTVVLNSMKRALFSGAHRLVFVPLPKLIDIRVKRPRILIEPATLPRDADETTLEDEKEAVSERGRESEQLMQILDVLLPMAEERAKREREARMREDWLAVGLVIDRLLFILFLLVFVFCSFGFIRR